MGISDPKNLRVFHCQKIIYHTKLNIYNQFKRTKSKEYIESHQDWLFILRSPQVNESTDITDNVQHMTFILFTNDEGVLVSSYFPKIYLLWSKGKIFL